MLEVHQVLRDRYQLQKLLSHNSLRQTWLAVDLDTQEQVVVKLLTFGTTMDWTNVKLFEREAEILKQLNYPQIPQYRDSFRIDEQDIKFVLVESYICGASFKELLAQGRKFSELEIENIAKDILQILIYLHEQNTPILHRDIKPSNLILGEDTRVYLVDFGAVQNRVATVGATFTVVGTYGYAPMEQFGDRAIPATDLYGLGATLIHLITGTSPADLPQKELRIQFNNFVSISPFLIQWLEHLTEPAPERRPSTAHQALEMLENKAFSISKSIQPQDTRINLKKSFDELNISIPPIDANIGSLPFFLISTVFITPFLAVASMLTVGFLLKPGITYIIPSVIICSILIPFVFMWFRTLESSCGRTEINLSRENFLVKLKLFGFTYNQKKGCNAEIKNIFSTTLERNIEYSRLALVIETNSKKHSISPPLTDVERLWLIQEIKNWLKIS
ncbi:serine/threonine protein kinase [Synechocystis sp. PCC 7509]|uniref:serine/threonine protein kinase n=1 Tax=Synechocystis sp. PCC 7509 TaxID=927677 RepID=UPI0002AC36BF|nr:serine/threonine-protein kinase [Synechocystis sp. PCC 7509]